MSYLKLRFGMEFISTKLTKQVFRSINGHYWYLKLRGYETEAPPAVRTVGRDYVLEHRTADPNELSALLAVAAGKVARRLARNDLAARGLFLQFRYADPTVPVWRGRRMGAVAAWCGRQLADRAIELYRDSPAGLTVKHLAMTAYALEAARHDQLALYDDDRRRHERLEEAMNAVNDRYGEQVLVPATVLASPNRMVDKVPFGTSRYFD